MKKKLCSLVTVIMALSLVFSIPPMTVAADPDDFAGGDGSADNPYQIENWYHLDCVRDHLGDHFVLMNDLDADTDGYAGLAGPGADGGKGWEPIGNWDDDDGGFVGTFDGQDHHIADIFIDRPLILYVALFGIIEDGAVIEAAGMRGGSVAGGGTVGCLVGYNYGGTVRDCHSSGSVSGPEDASDVGGLVGINFSGGTVSNCYATGSVTGTWSLGGLVGSNQGTVTSSYATGEVAGAHRIGGLVGDNYPGGTVSNCYATGSVTGTSLVGGLIGENDGTVSNCYATGSVTDTSTSGGLVGRNNDTVSNSFWDTNTSGMATSAGGTGKTTEEMQEIATYSEQVTTGLTWPWNILPVTAGATLPYAVWNIADGDDYPFLTFHRVEVEVKAGWNMVSVPGGLSGSEHTVDEVFGNQIVAIYYWNPVAKSYNVPTVLEPDQGYWVAVTEDKTLILRI